MVDREHTMVGWRLSHCPDSNSWQLCPRDCEWWGFDDEDAESASKTSSVPPHTGTAECMVTWTCRVWTCRVTLEDWTFRLLQIKQRLLSSALLDLPLSLIRISACSIPKRNIIFSVAWYIITTLPLIVHLSRLNGVSDSFYFISWRNSSVQYISTNCWN